MNNKKRNFKLATKIFPNANASIVISWPDGSFNVIVQVALLSDGQISDDVEMMKGIEELVRKRLNKSI